MISQMIVKTNFFDKINDYMRTTTVLFMLINMYYYHRPHTFNNTQIRQHTHKCYQSECYLSPMQFQSMYILRNLSGLQ